VNWHLISTGKYQYFDLIWKEFHAVYSTRTGQELLVHALKPVLLEQIHSAKIIDIDTDEQRKGDGLSTGTNKCLGIRVADCLPVYIFDQRKTAVLHCGWRGIINGIARKARKIFTDFDYALGASIGPCCYEIKNDVAQQFRNAYPNAISLRDGKEYLDLRSAVIQDLGAARLIGSLHLCTKCHPALFYSHRGGDTQRNYALLNREAIDLRQSSA
jgi:YfiH family protein